MRVVAFIVSILVATAALLGGVVLIVRATPDADPWVGPLATFALTVLVYGPLLLGSLNAYWDVRRTEESRRYYRWWFWIVVGLDVLAAVSIVVFSVAAASPVWVPVVILGGAALLLTLAVVVGRRLGARDERRPRGDQLLSVIDDAQIRRRILIVALTFVIAMAAGLVVTTLLALAESTSESPGRLVLFALQFAFLAATFAAIIVARPLTLALRESAGRDLGLVRKLARVVLRGQDIALAPDERVAAVRYAVVARTALGFQLGYSTLLYVALLLQYLGVLIDGQPPLFYTVLALALVVVLVVCYPIFIVRIRRAARYAQEHAALLDADGELQPS
ncbi:hypothetical protein E4M00_09235 [Leifsonia flava]|uniref:Uncharacterized protein n=1 Tax=Orlajensenia leifsoniae TaxID=2561933 RepID=A0A4Y9R133_9MICO|nr:hypothetical protein E4M00_09235 [Leifsonia flava]